MIKVIYVSSLFFLLSGCVSNYDSLNEIEKHTVKSDKLKLLMHDMNMVVYDNYKSELDRDNTRRRYALTLASNIKKFSSQIDKIPKNIDQNDTTLFNSYVKELQRQGEEIFRVAQNYELEKLDSKFHDMERTCKACHVKFRSK